MWFLLFQMVMIGAMALMFFLARGLLRNQRRRRDIWVRGHSTRARVIDTWAVAEGEDSVSYFEYEYTSPDGSPVRFSERGGPRGLRVGDEVRVYYLPGAPDGATAFRPGSNEAVTAVFVVFCGAGAVTAGMIASWHPGP